MNNEQIKSSEPTAGYRPRLTYYHANAKGTGSAVQFELHPAHDDVPGSIFASLAPQKSVGSAGPERTFPTFDWQNRITVKLDIDDLCQVLRVLRGEEESILDGKGLFHRSAVANTIVKFEHRLEPVPGYALDVSRKSFGTGEVQRISFLFGANESLGVALAFEHSLAVIAFGIPQVVPRRSDAVSAEVAGARQ